MNQLKIITILIAIIGSPKIGNCSEFASWWQKTPNNNEICNEKWNDQYVMGIICKDKVFDGERIAHGHIITNLNKWYFYKNQIIGEFNNENKKAFFIFDEATCKTEIFKEKVDFENRLQALDLVPKIWTRWYQSNWGIIFSSGDFGEQLTFFYLTLPILIATPIILLIGLISSNFNFKHKLNVLTLIVMGIIIARIFLDLMPNSI